MECVSWVLLSVLALTFLSMFGDAGTVLGGLASLGFMSANWIRVHLQAEVGLPQAILIGGVVPLPRLGIDALGPLGL